MSGLDLESAESFAEVLRSARRLDLASTAGALVKSMIQFYSVPEHQAFLAGAFVTASALRRMRPVPLLVATLAGGLAAERVYLAGAGIRADIRTLAARADEPDVPAA